MAVKRKTKAQPNVEATTNTQSVRKVVNTSEGASVTKTDGLRKYKVSCAFPPTIGTLTTVVRAANEDDAWAKALVEWQATNTECQRTIRLVE